MTSFREATLVDLDTIMALEHAAFPTDAWSSELMRSEVASEHTVYLLALDGDEVIGYGGVQAMAGNPDTDIQTITIDASRRGRGDGRALLRELIRVAIARDARHVFLDVRHDNTPARGLYDAEGFVEIGRRPRYYQPDDVDAVVMKLDLTTAVKEKLA